MYAPDNTYVARQNQMRYGHAPCQPLVYATGGWPVGFELYVHACV